MNTLINGISIKSVTDTTVTITGYGVVFGGKDLVGDTFTPATDFGLDRSPQGIPVYYDHRQGVLKSRIGKVSTVQADDYGLWVEAELDRRNSYVEHVMRLIEKGALGYSTGSVPHLVERSGDEIKSWVISELSLTPAPCEPRTYIQEVKSLEEETKFPPVDAPQEEKDNKDNPDIAELKSDYKSLAEKLDALMAKLEREPALTKAGYVTEGMVKGGNKNNAVKTFGNFLLAVKRNDEKTIKSYYSPDELKSMSEQEGGTGGYLVPKEFEQKIYEVAGETAIARSNGAMVLPISTRSIQIPVLRQNSSTVTNGSAFYGGVVATWTDEQGTISETTPNFELLEIVAYKMSGYTVVSNELRYDNPFALETYLSTLFGKAVSSEEDYQFLRGDGVGKPLGVVNAPATQSVTRTTAAGNFDATDASTMLSYLLPESMNRATWIMNPSLIPSLVGIAATSYVAPWIPSMNAGMPSTLLGRPIAFSQHLPAAGTANDVVLADWSFYTIVDRRGLEIAYSEHYKFDTDQVTWRFTKRVGGQPWVRDKIVMRGATSNYVSPFVKLA